MAAGQQGSTSRQMEVVVVGLSAQLETLGDRPYTALVGAGRVAIVAQAGPVHG